MVIMFLPEQADTASLALAGEKRAEAWKQQQILQQQARAQKKAPPPHQYML